MLTSCSKNILDIYKDAQSSLGVDKISFAAGQAARTPYSDDASFASDEKILNAEKFKTARTGDLNERKYSDGVRRD